MLEKLNAQSAHGKAVVKIENLRQGLRGCMVLLLMVLSGFAAKAQLWTGEYYILENNAQPGDVVTLVVSIGDANKQVSNQSSLTVTIPYNTSLLTEEGTADVEADNSFFVDPGSQFSYTVSVDEVKGEITLDIDLPSPATGSGYGELARIKGIMVLEDILKKPFSDIESTREGIKVFPNPSEGRLNIELPGDHQGIVRLYNISGQMVSEQRFESTDSQLQLDFEGMSSGRYWLQFPGSESTRPVAVEFR